jgi:hypothetical protein
MSEVGGQTNRPCTLAAILLLLPVAALAQTVEVKSESGLANARLMAARNAASGVTAQQCLADLASWDAKNQADERAKVKAPAIWYEKLSTEELVRLSSETVPCSTALRHAHYVSDSRVMIGYGRMFDNELLNRAEAVLRDHHLMHEYLLKSSE